jgi:hypothetical protein
MNALRAFAGCKKLTCALAVLLATYAGASGKLVGDRAAVDPLLAGLVDPLDAHGIDVVGGNIDAAPLSGRPRAALLIGVPPVPPPGYATAPWMKDFLSGATGFVAAAPRADSSAPPLKTQSEFIQFWNQTPKEQRVFISFTKQDARIAATIKATLEKKGFAAFTFLNPSVAGVPMRPTYDTPVVGKFFSEAGHYLVVDTPNARGSHGVWLESSALALVVAGRLPPSGPGGFPPTSPNSPRGPNAGPQAPQGGAPGMAQTDTLDKEAFVRGIRSGWVVTRNPSTDKIFVHRSQNGMYLEDLLYTAKAEKDGTWTVYDPGGTRVGSIKRPSGVSMGLCSCQ